LGNEAENWKTAIIDVKALNRVSIWK